MSVPSSSAAVVDSFDDTSVLEETKSDPTHPSLAPGTSATTDDVPGDDPPPAATRRWTLGGSLSSFSLRNLWIDTDSDKLATAEEELLHFCVDKDQFDVAQSDVPIQCDLRPEADRIPKKPSRLSSLFSGFISSTEPTKVKAESEESKSKSADDLFRQKLTIHTTTVSKKTPFGLGSAPLSAATTAAASASSSSSSAPDSSSTIPSSLPAKDEAGSGSETVIETPPIVLMHGYGCASGYFFQSTPMILDRVEEKLKKTHGSVKPQVHVLDWLGIGQSSRPSFPSSYTTRDTERWHVESLEEWRKAMGIQQMILVAHSLGAYMSAVYAMKYPSNVSHLVLISPVGVPKKPENSEDFLKGLDWKRRYMFQTFRYVWDAGYTPQDFVRWAGPKGKDWTRAVVERRLFRVEDTRFKSLLANYLFHVYAGDGSAEYALSKILEPGAWARTPLIERLHVLKHGGTDPCYVKSTTAEVDTKSGGVGSGSVDDKVISSSSSVVKPLTISSVDDETSMSLSNEEKKTEEEKEAMISTPGMSGGGSGQTVRVSCVYGESDWMNPEPMFELSREGKLDNTVHYCKDAGHQMVAENPSYLAKVVGNLVASSLKQCMLRESTSSSMFDEDGGFVSGSDSLSHSSSEAVYVGRKLGEVDVEREQHRLRKLKKEAKDLQSDGTLIASSSAAAADTSPIPVTAAATSTDSSVTDQK